MEKIHESNYVVSSINAYKKLEELYNKTDDEDSKKLIIEVMEELRNADKNLVKEFIIPIKKAIKKD